MASQEKLRRELRGAWWVNATALVFTGLLAGFLPDLGYLAILD